MRLLAGIGTQNLLTVGGIVAGAIVAFWILRKIVKFVLSLVIVSAVAVLAVGYCVKAGYISRESAESLNPLNRAEVRQAVRDAGSWVGAQARDSAKKAADAAIRETVDRLVPTNRTTRF